jgi:putative hydrolase of the HAD superfamily
MTKVQRVRPVLLFDWGNTLMREIPGASGPMSSWPRVEAIPHARDVLAALKLTFVIALATNAQASGEVEIRQALARVDLEGQVERIYGSRMIGHRKPEPGFFCFVLHDLGLSAAQAVMVGDSLENDVLGANACGIRAVWLNEAGSESREGALHATIHDLAELPAALARLAPDLVASSR